MPFTEKLFYRVVTSHVMNAVKITTLYMLSFKVIKTDALPVMGLQ